METPDVTQETKAMEDTDYFKKSPRQEFERMLMMATKRMRFEKYKKQERFTKVKSKNTYYKDW